MNAFSFVLIGFAASTLARWVMKNRLYSRFDDFLFGVLGALLGGSLDELFGLAPFALGLTLLLATAVSVFVLVAAGMANEIDGKSVRKVRVRTLRRRFVQTLVHVRRQPRDAALPRNTLHKQQVNTQTIRMGEI
jgi:uncharacterized membrane protein YeaQ/YmgE (transglycosylase-associated protein family)